MRKGGALYSTLCTIALNGAFTTFARRFGTWGIFLSPFFFFFLLEIDTVARHTHPQHSMVHVFSIDQSTHTFNSSPASVLIAFRRHGHTQLAYIAIYHSADSRLSLTVAQLRFPAGYRQNEGIMNAMI